MDKIYLPSLFCATFVDQKGQHFPPNDNPKYNLKHTVYLCQIEEFWFPDDVFESDKQKEKAYSSHSDSATSDGTKQVSKETSLAKFLVRQLHHHTATKYACSSSCKGPELPSVFHVVQAEQSIWTSAFEKKDPQKQATSLCEQLPEHLATHECLHSLLTDSTRSRLLLLCCFIHVWAEQRLSPVVSRGGRVWLCQIMPISRCAA